MTTINLYQNPEEKQATSARTVNGGFIFSIAILVITVLVYFGLQIAETMLTKQSQALSDNVKQQSASLAGVNDLQKVLDVEGRIEQIKNNLQITDSGVNRLKMNDVLDHLATDMSSGVTISSYEYTSGGIKVTFQTTNFSDAARQIYNFKNSKYFTNVNVGTITKGENSIGTDVTMDIKK